MNACKQGKSAVKTAGHWFGDTNCPAFGWVSAAADCSCRSGVLILPPFAYEYWTTHHSLQTLQERLADDGHLVLRMDYAGTGDAAGDLWDADCLARWQQQVKDAVAQLRNWGAQQITLIGLRFGALMALQMAQSLGVQRVVAWFPIISGRRYVRELRLIASQQSNDDQDGLKSNTECCYFAGIVLTESLFANIATLNLEPAPLDYSVLVIDRHDMPTAANYADKLRVHVQSLEYITVDDAASVLDVGTEEAGIAQCSIDAIGQQLGKVAAADSGRCGIPDLVPAVTWLANGQPLTERHFQLSDIGLSSIETIPADNHSGITVVFLNSGSEKHVGPGRAWVEFARALAVRGHRSVRVDFQGWGESPDNGHRPGRPYDIHGVADTRKIVDALREHGHAHIVLVGVCAGAWIALRDCQSLPVQGIVAFNPQLYYETTDPDLPNMKVTRAWYKEECVKESWPERRSVVREWMQRINALTYPVDFWFEQGDPGIYYLEQELPDMLTALGRHSMLSVNMLPGLDHSMHRHWLRHEALEAIEHLIARMKAGG
ncbi:MAG TPA: alpha/beta hydrolase family protein [Steroidobacteraceae bacterium]|nr:alpha/beta hydrolase family protein [Steroidobacteraceae bacterium]